MRFKEDEMASMNVRVGAEQRIKNEQLERELREAKFLLESGGEHRQRADKLERELREAKFKA